MGWLVPIFGFHFWATGHLNASDLRHEKKWTPWSHEGCLNKTSGSDRSVSLDWISNPMIIVLRHCWVENLYVLIKNKWHSFLFFLHMWTCEENQTKKTKTFFLRNKVAPFVLDFLCSRRQFLIQHRPWWKKLLHSAMLASKWRLHSSSAEVVGF